MSCLIYQVLHPMPRPVWLWHALNKTGVKMTTTAQRQRLCMMLLVNVLCCYKLNKDRIECQQINYDIRMTYAG